MFEYNFKWDMTEARFSDMTAALKSKRVPSDNLYGKVSIGKYDIEIVQEQPRHIVLNFYHLGIDRGYGRTKSGVPYDLEHELCISRSEILRRDFSGFKAMVESAARLYFEDFYMAEIKREVWCPFADWS